MFVFKIVRWLFRLVRGKALGGLSGKTVSSIAESLLGKSGAELPDLLKKLTTGGLGDAVQSWVSKGKNQQISTEQVKSSLGSKAMSEIAAKLGTSENTAASKVAGLLPTLVDKLTPQGEVPDRETLAKGLADLLKR